MENELEMIQTLFEYQNFGLAPFPIMPFSKEIHKGNKGKIFFDNAQSGIQMSEEEIYDYLKNRYGEFILLKPPFQKTTLILWLFPFLIFAAGILIIFKYNKKE